MSNEPFYTEGVPEVRSVDGGKTVVYGYAALFNVRSRELTTKKGVKFVEVIEPGAFDGTDFSDAVCCFNHETRDFLASQPNLRHGVDERGLWYEYEHDGADPVHVSTLRRIQRRDAKGSSFQFSPLPSSCFTVDKSGEMPLVTIRRFPRVAELGPVINPAYRGTTTHARSANGDGAYGLDVEDGGISTGSSGNHEEEQRNMDGLAAEDGGNSEEQQRKALEQQQLLELRKIEVRQFIAASVEGL